MSHIREMLKHLLTADYLGVEHKSSVLLSILRDQNLVRQAIMELRPRLDTSESTAKLVEIIEHLDPKWRGKRLGQFTPVEVQIASGRSAVEVALELQERLLNVNEVLTGRREILPEPNLVSFVQLMHLRFMQLNSCIAIDEYGEHIGQARYDALLVELHKLRHQ